MQGETIEEPHDFWCQCSSCHQTAMSLDTLRLARARLNAYRGMVSPAYITLYCHDPILTSFTMNRKLVAIADLEKHFKVGISMAWCKTAVSPLLTQWGYCSLVLSHWYLVQRGAVIPRSAAFKIHLTSHSSPMSPREALSREVSTTS